MSAEPKSIRSARDAQVGGTHYKALPIQPWDIIDSWPIQQQIGFHRGNALKYLLRMGSKGPSGEDARKAGHYCQKLAEVIDDE